MTCLLEGCVRINANQSESQCQVLYRAEGAGANKTSTLTYSVRQLNTTGKHCNNIHQVPYVKTTEDYRSVLLCVYRLQRKHLCNKNLSRSELTANCYSTAHVIPVSATRRPTNPADQSHICDLYKNMLSSIKMWQ